MTNTNLIIRDDLIVSLDYTLRLDDGQIVDSSPGEEPFEFIQGRGQIIRGLEAVLYGKPPQQKYYRVMLRLMIISHWLSDKNPQTALVSY